MTEKSGEYERGRILRQQRRQQSQIFHRRVDCRFLPNTSIVLEDVRGDSYSVASNQTIIQHDKEHRGVPVPV
jgi:hypothetical protein